MEVCIPLSKPCPHLKHWWTKHLSTMRQQVKDASKTAYQMCGLPLHPIHDELKTIKEQYANEINTTKKEHWLDWLNDIEGNDLWTANKYISSAPSDGGKTRVPSLTISNPDGSKSEAITNQEKSQILATSFFPPPLVTDSIPQDTIYPDPVACMPHITTDQIEWAISNLSGYKAPGPDGICNIVFKECSNCYELGWVLTT